LEPDSMKVNFNPSSTSPRAKQPSAGKNSFGTRPHNIASSIPPRTTSASRDAPPRCTACVSNPMETSCRANRIIIRSATCSPIHGTPFGITNCQSNCASGKTCPPNARHAQSSKNVAADVHCNLIEGAQYQKTALADERPYRVHLRLQADGSGVFIVNASTVLHLNPTAAECAYHFIKGTAPDDAAREIAARYRVKKTIALRD